MYSDDLMTVFDILTHSSQEPFFSANVTEKSKGCL
jgi:hypothetical protein